MISTRSSLYFAATVVLLGGTLLASRLTDQRRPEPLAQPLSTISRNIGEWTGTDTPPLDERTLQVLRPTSYLDRVYRRGADQLFFFVAYYSEQRAGENMHSPKNCLPGSGWEIWDYGSASVPVGNGKVEVNRYSVQNDGRRLVTLYWYQSRERIVASEYLGKVLLVHDALLRGNTAGSIVRITVPDTPRALDDGIRFASSAIGEMQRCLGPIKQ
jgi:EpsI family protein